MAIEHIQPPDVFESARFGFTQVVASPPGRQIFVSGQVAWDAGLEIVGEGDVGVQAEKALENLRNALAAAGAGPADITSMRVYIVDLSPDKIAKIGAPVARFFEGVAPPASTWLGVQALVGEGLLIEIEATAVVSA